MAELYRFGNTETIQSFMVVSCSVSTSTSAILAQVGPFRGLFFRTSASCTIIGFNNQELALDNVIKNTVLWIQGNHVSVIATATSIYALR